MNKMFFGLRLFKSVIRLFGFLIVGFEVVLMVICILLVIIIVRVVFFNFGGLYKRMWFKVFLCDLVV